MFKIRSWWSSSVWGEKGSSHSTIRRTDVPYIMIQPSGESQLVFLFVEKNMFLAFINYHRPQRLKAANAKNKQTQTVNRNVNSNVQWHSCQVSQCLRRFRSNLGGKTKSLQAYGVLLTAWWSAFHPTNSVQDYLEINTNGHEASASISYFDSKTCLAQVRCYYYC